MGNDLHSINKIYEFIDSAAHSRKYLPNTASALKTATRLFESELTDEEKQSVELIQQNLSNIHRAVFEKNKTKYTASSLDVYRKRVSKVIKDYLAYGVDPSKMHGWNPTTRKPVERRQQKSALDKSLDQNHSADKEHQPDPDSVKIEWPFSNTRKAIILLPDNLSQEEAEVLKNLIGMRAEVNKNES
jgi:hypothetical protein